MKKLICAMVAIGIFLMVPALLFAAEKMQVMLYSSMKDSQLEALKKGFTKKYPDIRMDYYTAGTGKVMTKLSAEERAGNIAADIIWVGEPTNYFTFKDKGMLLSYSSPEAKTIPKKLIDKDNTFCGARIVTLGLVYNVNAVKGADIPTDWDDLAKPRFSNHLAVMTDPSFSGTTLYTVAGLSQNPKYGWEFFKKLKANGMRLEKGSTASVEKVGSGEYDISIGVDYIAMSWKKQGSPVAFVYPKSGISVIASPIAIMKASKNVKTAKLLYDYILSIDGQNVLVKAEVLPVRPEVELEKGATPVKEILERALPVDDKKLTKEKDGMIDKFNAIMKKK